MSTITPSSHIASISGRLSRTDRVHTRANRTTGKTYGVALTNPNPQAHPTESQQRARLSFRDTWHAVDTLLAVPALRTYFTALWQAHTAACRHHRPLSQSVFDSIPFPEIEVAADNIGSPTAVSVAGLASPPVSSPLNTVPSSQPLHPLFEEGAGGVLSLLPILRSRRTSFSTVRTMLFHLLYP